MLKKRFFQASYLSAIASGLNVLATIAIARWYGAEAFTDFTVDLAIVGMFLLLLEVIPSNYAVFKVQDEPEWLHSVSAVQTICALALILGIFLIGKLGIGFNQYSPWILLFVAASAGKRFLDIRLQSSGRLSEYFMNEVMTALIRLPIIMSGLFLNFTSANVLWCALATGMVVSQSIWWLKNKSDIKYLYSFRSRAAWQGFYCSKSSMHQYYFGTVLKRFKDNMIPIAADLYFISKDALAVFFLSYRGLLFVIGQIRILEALVNHRITLAAVELLSLLKKAKLALLAQSISIITSFGLVYASGIGPGGFGITLILSLMVWPLVFYIFERAKAYSNYESSKVNKSILLNIFIFVTSISILKMSGVDSAALFAMIMIASEVSSYILISSSRKLIR